MGPAGPTGSTGPAGPTGPPATFKGPWSVSWPYVYGNVVSHEGRSYVAMTNVLGVEPTIPLPPQWDLLADKGADGPVVVAAGAGFAARGEWQPDVDYPPGDVVYTESGIYQALYYSAGDDPDTDDAMFIAGLDGNGNAAQVSPVGAALEGYGITLAVLEDFYFDRVTLYFDPSGSALSGTITVEVIGPSGIGGPPITSGILVAHAELPAAGIVRSETPEPTLFMLNTRVLAAAGESYAITVRGTGVGSVRAVTSSIGYSPSAASPRPTGTTTPPWAAPRTGPPPRSRPATPARCSSSWATAPGSWWPRRR